MSRSIDLLIDSDLPLDRLAAELGGVAGADLVPAITGDSFVLQKGPVQAVLSEHRFAGEGDLPLAHYRYALSARVASAARPDGTPEAAALRDIAHKIRESALWPALLVLDLQYREGDSAPACEPAEGSRPGGSGAGEPAMGAPAIGDPAMGEPAMGDPAMGEPAMGESGEALEPGEAPRTGEAPASGAASEPGMAPAPR